MKKKIRGCTKDQLINAVDNGANDGNEFTAILLYGKKGVLPETLDIEIEVKDPKESKNGNK